MELPVLVFTIPQLDYNALVAVFVVWGVACLLGLLHFRNGGAL